VKNTQIYLWVYPEDITGLMGKGKGMKPLGTDEIDI
jgi:hypothetical protein